MQKSRKKRTVFIIALLSVIGVIWVLPFIWMILSSFKTTLEITSTDFSIWPKNFTLDNFHKLFYGMKFGLYLKNNIIVTALTMLSVLFNAMAGYAFAQFKFKFKAPLFALVLATMMMPTQVTMIPLYLLLSKVNLTNTFLGIVLPSLATGFGIFLFRQFINNISNDFIEAARLDGANELYLFFRVILPLSKPILSVQVILTFVTGWNTFLWSLIMSNGEDHYTLSVGLTLMQDQFQLDYGLMMAGATIMLIPVIIVYIVFQKRIIKGISISSYK